MNKDYFELLKSYSKLGIRKRKIIEFLYEQNPYNKYKYVEISYIQMARRINIDTNNFRRELHELEKYGVVEVFRKHKDVGTRVDGRKNKNPMLGCVLAKDWCNKIIEMNKGEK